MIPKCPQCGSHSVKLYQSVLGVRERLFDCYGKKTDDRHEHDASLEYEELQCVICGATRYDLTYDGQEVCVDGDPLSLDEPEVGNSEISV